MYTLSQLKEYKHSSTSHTTLEQSSPVIMKCLGAKEEENKMKVPFPSMGRFYPDKGLKILCDDVLSTGCNQG